jgi:hypothetical protein
MLSFTFPPSSSLTPPPSSSKEKEIIIIYLVAQGLNSEASVYLLLFFSNFFPYC